MDIVAMGALLIALILFIVAIAWAFGDIPDEPAPPEK